MKVIISCLLSLVGLLGYSSAVIALPTDGLEKNFYQYLTNDDVKHIVDSNKVGAPLVYKLAVFGEVEAVVAFRVPFSGRRVGQEKIREWNEAVRKQRNSIFTPFVGKGLKIKKQYDSVNMVTVILPAGAIKGLIANPLILRVDLPTKISASLAQAGALVNLGQAHTASPTQGSGGTVVILDTGIRSTHVDFTNRVAGEMCFCTSCCPNGQDTMSGTGSAADGHGHGTHVAGIAAGAGLAAPSVGGAPGADILAIKVLSDLGGGDLTDVVAGLNWLINNQGSTSAVNLSLGSSTLYSGDCDSATASTIGMATAVNTLYANGIPVIAASGNDGSTTQMGAPACISKVVSVGDTYDTVFAQVSWTGVCTDTMTQADQVTCNSNRNAETDIYAPGAMIISSYNTSDTSVYELGGTSMSSPLVAGCAGLIMTDFSTLSVGDLVSALRASPTVIYDAPSNTAIPRLDCGDAYIKAQALAIAPEPDLAWLVPVINLILF